MAIPQNGLASPPTRVGIDNDKLAQHMIPLTALLSTEQLQLDAEEESPLLSHGHDMLYKKEEDFVLAKTDCERVPGNPSSTYAAFAVRLWFPSKSYFFITNFAQSLTLHNTILIVGEIGISLKMHASFNKHCRFASHPTRVSLKEMLSHLLADLWWS